MNALKNFFAHLIVGFARAIAFFTKYIWPGVAVIAFMAFAIREPKGFLAIVAGVLLMLGAMWLYEWAKIQSYQAKADKRYEQRRKHWSNEP